MAVAGCVVIETVAQPGFLARVTAAGEHLAGSLRALANRHGCGEVRGRGLLLALDLKRDIAAAVVINAMKEGLLLNAPRPDTLRFMPALTISNGEVDRMIDILDGILRELTTT
jgi:acetylornithine/N-succinyldiaminopimelate aminotransferase